MERIALEFERAARGLDEVEPEIRVRRRGGLDGLLDELGPPGSLQRLTGFFPRFLTHRKGPAAGNPFELERFQTDFLKEFHRVDGTGRRIYKLGYLIIPGGNGKSPLAAGHGLEALCELKDAPEIYCLAGKKEQADIVQSFARDFVEGTEDEPGELRSYLRIRGKRILNKHTGGVMTILPASGATLEGKSPNVVIVDEPHAFETRKQIESFAALIGKLQKRFNAYALMISTAGRGEKNFLRQKIKEILAVGPVEQRGPYLTVVRDEKGERLLWMYHAPREAPLASQRVIRGCNPASWLDPRDIVQQLAGVGENEYRRLARNEWVAVKDQWMRPGLWDALARPRKKQPADRTDVVLAFDGSYNNDSTALVGWAIADKHLFVVQVWERPEGDTEWVVPRGEVNAAVHAAMARWNVLGLIADPPGWYEEIAEWGRIYEDVMVVVQPTNEIKMMAQACREFYGDVVSKAFSHDGDPTLARHIANAYVRETPDGAYIVKDARDSPNKIDAAVAAVLVRFFGVRAKPKKRRRVVSW